MIDEVTLPVPLDPLPKHAEDKRLWIGNLDTRITEFKLLKLLQKFGPIKNFDLLFHRSGPLEGQPRGYAFVTYSSTEIAAKAKVQLHGKTIGCKNICVKWAHNMTKGEMEKPKLVPDIPALAGAKSEKKSNVATTIQAIEAKLKMMENCEGTSKTDFEITDKPLITPTSTASLYSQNRQQKKYNFEKHKQKPYKRSNRK